MFSAVNFFLFLAIKTLYPVPVLDPDRYCSNVGSGFNESGSDQCWHICRFSFLGKFPNCKKWLQIHNTAGKDDICRWYYDRQDPWRTGELNAPWSKEVGKRQGRAYVTVKQSAGTAGIACKGKKASFILIIILLIIEIYGKHSSSQFSRYTWRILIEN